MPFEVAACLELQQRKAMKLACGTSGLEGKCYKLALLLLQFHESTICTQTVDKGMPSMVAARLELKQREATELALRRLRNRKPPFPIHRRVVRFEVDLIWHFFMDFSLRPHPQAGLRCVLFRQQAGSHCAFPCGLWWLPLHVSLDALTGLGLLLGFHLRQFVVLFLFFQGGAVGSLAVAVPSAYSSSQHDPLHSSSCCVNAGSRRRAAPSSMLLLMKRWIRL